MVKLFVSMMLVVVESYGDDVSVTSRLAAYILDLPPNPTVQMIDPLDVLIRDIHITELLQSNLSIFSLLGDMTITPDPLWVPMCRGTYWNEFRDATWTAIRSLPTGTGSVAVKSIHTPEFATAAMLADTVFADHYLHWPTMNCSAGFLTSVLFRTVPFFLADREGWLERFLVLSKILWDRTGTVGMIREGFPVFPFLALLSTMSTKDDGNELILLPDLPSSHFVLLTVAYSVENARGFARRWTAAVANDTSIVVASRTCDWATPSPNFFCVTVPFSSKLSVKYRTMLALLPRHKMVEFIDVDAVPLQRDVTTYITGAVDNCTDATTVGIPSYYSINQLYPWCMIVCNSSSNQRLVDAMADWVATNPSPVEAQGLATLLGYHSSHTYIASYSDGIETSFLRVDRFNTISSRLVILNSRTDFVSTDGWVGPEQPVVFYPGDTGTEDPTPYRKTPQSSPLLNVDRMHITALNYADGCCWQSQALNSKTALQFGADAVISYNRSSLDPEFLARNSHILSHPKGAGYWLWKPWIILDALMHHSVPWDDGVVVYLDSGNHYVGDIRWLVEDALTHSDISAPALTCCMESDWTKRDALLALDADMPETTDRPQIAAYFIIVRKTAVAIEFLQEWLAACGEEHLIGDTPSMVPNHPMFHRHVNDQSLFSVLFRKYGFESLPLAQAARYINLARWRE